MSTYEPTVYFEFTVTVKLYSSQYTPYYRNATVSLSEYGGSKVLGTASASGNQGIVTLVIYFDSLGDKIITAKAMNTPVAVVQSIVHVNAEVIKAILSRTVRFT